MAESNEGLQPDQAKTLPHEPPRASVPALVVRQDAAGVVDRLFPMLEAELRALAAAALRSERPDHTLQTTALINEAYLRLCGQRNLEAGCREAFLAAAATTIRRILIDHARARACNKRQGDRQRLTLEFLDDGERHHAFDLLELHDCLVALARRSERQSRVIEMRFFGGLSIPQVATALGISISTVQADWRAGRAWCLAQLAEAGA